MRRRGDIDDQAIINVLDEQWRTVPQIRRRISGKLGSAHELMGTLRRLAETGLIERSSQPTQAVRRRQNRKVGSIAIELFRRVEQARD